MFLVKSPKDDLLAAFLCRDVSYDDMLLGFEHAGGARDHCHGTISNACLDAEYQARTPV